MTSPDSPEPSEAILDMGARGMPVADLHVALQRAGYDVPITEMEQQLLGPLTQQAIARYQQDHGLEPTGKADPPTLAALLGPDSKQPVAAEKQRNPRRARVAAIRRRSGEADHPDGGGAGGLMYTVTGVVSSPDSPAVSGLKVILVDKNVGGDVPLGDATTDARGAFQISAGVASASSAKPRKTQPDLQVRVSLGSRFLAASEVRYNASTTETLNVVLPAQTGALPSEYEALIAAIGSHYDGNLADIQETKDRQDITFLANKSGWDARAVAMAAFG